MALQASASPKGSDFSPTGIPEKKQPLVNDSWVTNTTTHHAHKQSNCSLQTQDKEVPTSISAGFAGSRPKAQHWLALSHSTRSKRKCSCPWTPLTAIKGSLNLHNSWRRQVCTPTNSSCSISYSPEPSAMARARTLVGDRGGHCRWRPSWN